MKDVILVREAPDENGDVVFNVAQFGPGGGTLTPTLGTYEIQLLINSLIGHIVFGYESANCISQLEQTAIDMAEGRADDDDVTILLRVLHAISPTV